MVGQSFLSPSPFPELSAELVTTLMTLRDPQQRLARLVEEARQRPPLEEAYRTDTHRVSGCLVRTWFVCEIRRDQCHFRCDSDAATLKAILGFLCDVFNQAPIEEVADRPVEVLQQLGVLRQLAPNRQATILRVAGQMQAFARDHRADT